MTAPQTSPLEPAVETQSIRTYCDVLFGYLDGLVPIRLLPEAGTPDQKPRLDFPAAAALADRLISIAPEAANLQRGVFVVPGTVAAAGSAKAKDILQTGVILVDLDHGDISAKAAHLVRHLGPPSLEVASGGMTDDGQSKRHLYWRLTEAAIGEDVSRAAALRGTLATKVGGDPAFRSAHQPIRVAGTIHGKNGNRASVSIIACGAQEYELAELAEAIASMPPMPGLSASPGGAHRCPAGPPAHDLATTRIAAGGQDGETRFAVLSKVIGHWLRNARRGICTLENAWKAVRDHNAAMIDPPWEETRLRREFEALLAKDIVGRGAMPPTATGERTDNALIAPDLSDDAIAADFVARHSQHWKHVSAWGAWFRWDGTVWGRDETGLVREMVRQVCRAAAQRADKPAERDGPGISTSFPPD